VQGLSRREFLGGAAGVAAVAALPASATIPSRHASLRARRSAAITPAFGATVDLASYGSKNYLDAANTFDGLAGLPMATTIQKVYMGHGEFPPHPPLKMTQLAKAGCEFLVSIEPSRSMVPSEQALLAKWLTMMNNSGIPYRVVLYSESNDKAFKTAPEWFAYWSYYAPVVKDAGVVLAYNCGCGFKALPRAEAYFPSNPTPDELWMDFYATSFRGGSRLDTLIGQADNAGIPAGIAEWDWSAGNLIFTPMTLPWWNAYCEYIVTLATAGKLGLGAIFFNAVAKGGFADVISSASDPRIPGIHRVAQAF
jgi:TAT (twin-arginine translocation) pathway-exported protein